MFYWWWVLPRWWLPVHQDGGCWRARLVVAMSWQKTTMKPTTGIDSSSHEWFSHCMWCFVLHLSYSGTSFKVRLTSFKPWCCFTNLVPVVFYMFCCHFNNLHNIFTRVVSMSRNHFLHSSVRSNPWPPQVLWVSNNLVMYSGSISHYSFLVVSTTSAGTSSTKALNPSKSPKKIDINFFHTPVNVDIWTSSHESQMFPMTSRMLNTFQKVFHQLCPDPSEESQWQL